MKLDWFITKWYLLVFSIMAVIAYAYNVLLEGTVLFVSFHYIRYSFPKTYHSNGFYTCILISLTTAWLIIPRVLPFQYSIFSCLLLGWLVGYYAYRVQDDIDMFNNKINELQNIIDKFSHIPKINPYALDEEDLYDHCRSLGLDDEYCKIANMFIYQKLKGKKFYKAIGYSASQAKRIRNKIQIILGIKED